MIFCNEEPNGYHFIANVIIKKNSPDKKPLFKNEFDFPIEFYNIENSSIPENKFQFKNLYYSRI